MTISPGRFTAGNDKDIVVFQIGMRFNGWRGLGSALQVAREMPTMLAELAEHKELGLLETRLALEWPVLALTQYWRSFDDLERFATGADHTHLPAWKRFNKLGREGLGTGIWHETYRVQAGQYESIYVNMPRFGLAKALDHRPLAPGEDRARGRAPLGHAEAPATAG